MRTDIGANTAAHADDIVDPRLLISRIPYEPRTPEDSGAEPITAALFADTAGFINPHIKPFLALLFRTQGADLPQDENLCPFLFQKMVNRCPRLLQIEGVPDFHFCAHGLADLAYVHAWRFSAHGIYRQSRMRLESGHCRAAVVQHDQENVGFVVDGVDQGR